MEVIIVDNVRVIIVYNYHANNYFNILAQRNNLMILRITYHHINNKKISDIAI